MLINEERAAEKMQRYGLIAMIATHPENVAYVTDHQSHYSTFYRFHNIYNHALLGATRDIPSALIIPPGDAGWAVEYPPLVDEVYLFGHGTYRTHEQVPLNAIETRFAALLDQREKYGQTAGDALIKCLKDRGITKGKVGLDERCLDPVTREKLKIALPQIQFLDTFELFRVIRMVKTPSEIERLRQAALINEKALNDVMDHFRVGVTEEELAFVFRSSTAQKGALLEFLHANNGRRASYPLISSGCFDPPSDYRVQSGDLYKFDGGSIFRKYHSDTGHCFLAGELDKYVLNIHQSIRNAMNYAREIIKPGIKASEVFMGVVDAMAKGGIKNYGPFCGHGIGLEARDYPLFSLPTKSDCPYFPGSTDLPLEANMVVNVEIPYRELGYACWQMEHSLLVTKNGNELLIPQNRELKVL